VTECIANSIFAGIDKLGRDLFADAESWGFRPATAERKDDLVFIIGKLEPRDNSSK
jgi:hypothetical protein